MGLDIKAFRGLRKLENFALDDWEEPIDPSTRKRIACFRAYINPRFAGRAEGVEPDAYYLYDEEFSFSAGSYSGYNDWRDTLATLGRYEKASKNGARQALNTRPVDAWAATSGPFWELVHFSDCDGTLGPEISRKLGADFAAHHEQAKTHGDYFYERYLRWEKAFQVASDGGAVSFR